MRHDFRLVGFVRRATLLAATVVTFSGTGGCAQACPAALLTGVLTQQNGELIVLQQHGGQERVVWSSAYTVRRVVDELIVTDLLGKVVAREGDTVYIGGGESEGRTWVECGGISTEPPWQASE